MSSDALIRLPDRACALLTSLNAPPRLVAQLRVVHHVAVDLTGWLGGLLEFDREAVVFGAAVYDIGKVLHFDELSGPGSAHEETGYTLLRERGVPERLARFARTHGRWRRPGVALEDLLVSLADRVWRGERPAELEHLVVGRVAAEVGREAWEVFLGLDDVLTEITAQAGARVAFVRRHPVVA
ncbi:HD domain-containing protein [Pseudonocardiaceae bacterium YIM PH 21723]|nr:HD domain-containing protein [Pseudonocardiaceae bacterium YIM PH 21723]